MAVSVPANQFDAGSALMCPASTDPSKVDNVETATCITWHKPKPDRDASGADVISDEDVTSEATKAASPNETDQFILDDYSSVPISAQGEIFRSINDEKSKGKNVDFSDSYPAAAGMLFPGSPVKRLPGFIPKAAGFLS